MVTWKGLDIALEMSSVEVFVKLRRESIGGGGGCSIQQRGVGGLQESIAMGVERSLPLDGDIQVQVLRPRTLVDKSQPVLWEGGAEAITGTAFLGPAPPGEFEDLSGTTSPPSSFPYV